MLPPDGFGLDHLVFVAVFLVAGFCFANLC
jgi:hypothetical protein